VVVLHAPPVHVEVPLIVCCHKVTVPFDVNNTCAVIDVMVGG
jgi:hypothetical protein